MVLFERLQAEFGDAVTLREASAIEGVLPQCTASPRDDEAARALVRWCGQNDIAFLPRGGGTKLHIGARPSRCDLILSTEHLNNVIEHDEGNATVQAGSGIPLKLLNSHVARYGQFVPLDWREESAATLGGVVATNHFGATKLRYGAPRDLVVGLHAVLSDGRHIKAGSKVVKNVSGYDLNKLFIGSFGTLGLMTQVTIRLRPREKAFQNWSSQPASWEDATSLAQMLTGADFEPVSLRLWSIGGELRLVAKFAGSAAAIEAQMERLPEAIDAPEPHFDLPNGHCPDELELRAVLPLQRAASWAQRAEQDAANWIFWDCGTGIVGAGWQQAPENGAKLVKELRDAATASEGFVRVERAPANWKTPAFVWGAPRADFALMQHLKSTFDAANVCAPGRFIGGI